MFRAAAILVLVAVLAVGAATRASQTAQHPPQHSTEHQNESADVDAHSDGLLPMPSVPKINFQQNKFDYVAAEHAPKHSGEGSVRWTDIAVVVLTAGLFLAALLQWDALRKQVRKLGETIQAEKIASAERAKETERQISVSEKIADAAIAALDRPWLFLDRKEHNTTVWTRGKDDLTVIFSLSNYGKAPAFIHSIRAAIFPSPGPKSKIPPAIINGTKSNVIDFPEVESLADFKEKYCRPPLSEQRSVRTGPTTATQTEGYVPPVVVGGQSESAWFAVFGRPKVTVPEKGIPVEAAMNTYFIGTVLYSGPDDEIVQAIDFCYGAKLGGPFEIVRGPPYNARRRADAK